MAVVDPEGAAILQNIVRQKMIFGSHPIPGAVKLRNSAEGDIIYLQGFSADHVAGIKYDANGGGVGRSRIAK